ncbi:TetR/AcrR family transcriptional regulator C-terminal domain-containing protein [Actinoallomurus sp. NBC_01490]|jgi:AcrR family transcriptional regulator|uniref:TetR/AcrR family transcriptional regulator C-terminal domain-containing protein n=1 Tax=Actinoallomurus sp. NBC_01490 TaxID=2903557 RepID=UPI002E315494|nr:TetR/AcrR family transcriptional regulator C-terminal domain-containing protein [Actinoallomurus sp. NBC_01490]
MATRHERAGLSREKVLDAALELVDQVGVDGLSMRKLGAALGVEAMTLYHYVPNKDALLSGLVERTATRAFTVDAAAGWQAMLRGFAAGFRRELLAHPGVVPLVATRPVTTPSALRELETAVAILRAAGFGTREAFHVVNTVATFTTGHCLAEVDPPGAAPPALAGPDPAALPHLAEAVRDGLGTPADHEARFAFALDALIDGFARVLARRSPDEGGRASTPSAQGDHQGGPASA